VRQISAAEGLVKLARGRIERDDAFATVNGFEPVRGIHQDEETLRCQQKHQQNRQKLE
jgi:hypothetical protein